MHPTYQLRAGQAFRETQGIRIRSRSASESELKISLVLVYLLNTEPMDDCLLWLGSTGSGGYGVGPHDLPLHRFVWTLIHGQVPTGHCVLHTCDRPPCIQPAHLHLGTHKDNSREMVERGRSMRGRRRLRLEDRAYLESLA